MCFLLQVLTCECVLYFSKSTKVECVFVRHNFVHDFYIILAQNLTPANDRS